jgi:hypothetical protein
MRKAYLHIMLKQGTRAHDLMKIRDPESVITNLKYITQKMVESEFALTLILYSYFCEFNVTCFGQESNRLRLVLLPFLNLRNTPELQ